MVLRCSPDAGTAQGHTALAIAVARGNDFFPAGGLKHDLAFWKARVCAAAQNTCSLLYCGFVCGFLLPMDGFVFSP